MLTFYSSFKLFIDTSRYIHAVILLQMSRLNNDEVEPNVITFIVRKVSCSEDFKRSTDMASLLVIGKLAAIFQSCFLNLLNR